MLTISSYCVDGVAVDAANNDDGDTASYDDAVGGSDGGAADDDSATDAAGDAVDHEHCTNGVLFTLKCLW